MPLEVRTFDEALELARALLRGYVPGADVSEGSDYDAKARMLAALFAGNQGQAESLAKQIHASSADGDHLLRHAEVKLGGDSALGATRAAGVVQLIATSGTPTQPVDSVLEHVDGTTFKTTQAVTLRSPTWVGKSVVAGSGRTRILVAPDAADIAVGDVAVIDGNYRLIQGVDATVGFIDLWEPLPRAPTAGQPITAAIGAGVTIRADETGRGGNKLQGDTLELASPVGTIAASARIVGLSGGAATETPEELRARVVAHDQQPPGNGNAGEMRAIARTVTEHRIADAAIYSGFRGLGTTDVIPIGPSRARRITDAQITAVSDALAALPYVDDVNVLASTLSDYIEAHVEVEHEVGFEPDWYGSFQIQASIGGLGAVALSTTTRLLLNATPVGTIEQGDRVMIQQLVGAVWVVYERTVATVEAGAITLTDPLPHAPIDNPDGRHDVYPGGPNAPAIYAAIEGVFDVLGPGDGSAPRRIRFPLPSVDWDPVLRVANLIAATKAQTGVRDIHVTTIDDTTPDDIVPAAQETLRQGQIRVTFVEPT